MFNLKTMLLLTSGICAYSVSIQAANPKPQEVKTAAPETTINSNESQKEAKESSMAIVAQQSQEPKQTEAKNDEAKEIKQKLSNILVEILGIQRACEMINIQWLVPEIFKGRSYDSLVRQQKILIPQAKELIKKLSTEEWVEVDTKAKKTASAVWGMAFDKD